MIIHTIFPKSTKIIKNGVIDWTGYGQVFKGIRLPKFRVQVFRDMNGQVIQVPLPERREIIIRSVSHSCSFCKHPGNYGLLPHDTNLREKSYKPSIFLRRLGRLPELDLNGFFFQCELCAPNSNGYPFRNCNQV